MKTKLYRVAIIYQVLIDGNIENCSIIKNLNAVSAYDAALAVINYLCKEYEFLHIESYMVSHHVNEHIIDLSYGNN